MKSTLFFYFCFVLMLISSRNGHWNKTSTQTFHKITYNTFILIRRCKGLDRNFLFIGKSSSLLRLHFVPSFSEGQNTANKITVIKNLSFPKLINISLLSCYKIILYGTVLFSNWILYGTVLFSNWISLFYF